MDKIKEVVHALTIRTRSWPAPQKLAALRTEADTAHARAEAAEAKNKAYEQTLLERDNDITSLTHKLGVAEADLEKAEQRLAALKKTAGDADAAGANAEALQRTIAALELERDRWEKKHEVRASCARARDRAPTAHRRSPRPSTGSRRPSSMRSCRGCKRLRPASGCVSTLFDTVRARRLPAAETALVLVCAHSGSGGMHRRWKWFRIRIRSDNGSDTYFPSFSEHHTCVSYDEDEEKVGAN
jgi:hypothetical protein